MKAIVYSSEHVHIYEDGEETCYLSRNWSTCTAGTNHKSEHFDEVEDPRYYNGNEWVELNPDFENEISTFTPAFIRNCKPFDDITRDEINAIADVLADEGWGGREEYGKDTNTAAVIRERVE
jgi:hypothetical protein